MVLLLLLLLFIFIVLINYIAHFVSCVFGRTERVTKFPEGFLNSDATTIVMPKCT
jgi:hypothetical protein